MKTKHKKNIIAPKISRILGVLLFLVTTTPSFAKLAGENLWLTLNDSSAISTKDFFEQKIDPDRIRFFSEIPSVELSNLFLDNMASSRFLEIILRQYISSEEDKKHQIETIELALKKGVNLKKIKLNPSALSLKLGKLFLQYGLKPHDIVNLILSSTNSNLTEHQKELFTFILTQNIDLNQIWYPEAMESLRKKELFAGRNQGFLIKNLSSILDSTEDSKDFHDLRKNIKENQRIVNYHIH